jgi:hypothetical protein
MAELKTKETFMSRWNSVRYRRRAFTAAVVLTLVPDVFAADDGPVVGTVVWRPGLERDANPNDRTNYWAAIAYSPSTGKFGAACNWTADVNASRDAREKCAAPDARTVVMCGNGWCSLALGDDVDKWGVGWGESRETAEKFAFEVVAKRTRNAKVAFSINAREMRLSGSIAYSETTGAFGYAAGGGRSSQFAALKHSKTRDAKVLVTKYDCWLALAVGDYRLHGYGFAGNRADAERNALNECAKRTKNGRLQVSFCTNGVECALDEIPRPPSVAPCTNRRSAERPTPWTVQRP